MATLIASEAALRAVRLAQALGASGFGGELSRLERELIAAAAEVAAPEPSEIEHCVSAIAAREDPLGDLLTSARLRPERKRSGLFLTPADAVASMANWIAAQDVDQVVDAGAGSGRLAAACLRADAHVSVVAVERDPLASLLCRGHLAQLGGNVRVLNGGYLTSTLPRSGRTGFISNPPYVRHHDIPRRIKAWAAAASKESGKHCSALAGLHVYFYLATARRAQPGDVGCFITSAEWTDVKYGGFLRWLLAEDLGLESMHFLDVREVPFHDAMTTALITCFRPKTRCEAVGVRTVPTPSSFGDLRSAVRSIPRAQLQTTPRWSTLFEPLDWRPLPDHAGVIPLRDVARVHRGIATGANGFFVLSAADAAQRGLLESCRPCVSSARQVIASGGTLRADAAPKVLLAIEPGLTLSDLSSSVRQYLREGIELGIPERYLCRHRSPWWSLGRAVAPPIVMTYMGRRGPVFAHNPENLLILNIAHGIFPAVPWDSDACRRLVVALNERSQDYRGFGRSYHGGMEKFEPSEAEQLLIPADLVPQPASYARYLEI